MVVERSDSCGRLDCSHRIGVDGGRPYERPEVVSVVGPVLFFLTWKLLFLLLGCQSIRQAVEVDLVGRECPQAGMRSDGIAELQVVTD